MADDNLLTFQGLAILSEVHDVQHDAVGVVGDDVVILEAWLLSEDLREAAEDACELLLSVVVASSRIPSRGVDHDIVCVVTEESLMSPASRASVLLRRISSLRCAIPPTPLLPRAQEAKL